MCVPAHRSRAASQPAGAVRSNWGKIEQPPMKTQIGCPGCVTRGCCRAQLADERTRR